MKLKANFPGFSLIEVSISLLIVGLISSICMNQLKAVLKLNAKQKTHSNIDFVVRSLGAYYMASAKIPFPSSLTLDVGLQKESMKDSFGIVPFRTLGIMEKFAKNGYGKWLLYKMNPFYRLDNAERAKRNLGIDEFASEDKKDKVIFIIKSQNAKGEDELQIWYSQNVFIANFCGNKPYKGNEAQTELPTPQRIPSTTQRKTQPFSPLF
ncbi:hypothetical protein FACS1894113_0710 [Alphaproteobacteria bacterium]|nr:hypothetical protein FACS1894113_0710 [Alphaproteobacteria bacterium]